MSQNPLDIGNGERSSGSPKLALAAAVICAFVLGMAVMSLLG
jgi:hypothetical protein